MNRGPTGKTEMWVPNAEGYRLALDSLVKLVWGAKPHELLAATEHPEQLRLHMSHL